jgi:translation initiation factor IF-1
VAYRYEFKIPDYYGARVTRILTMNRYDVVLDDGRKLRGRITIPKIFRGRIRVGDRVLVWLSLANSSECTIQYKSDRFVENLVKRTETQDAKEVTDAGQR